MCKDLVPEHASLVASVRMWNERYEKVPSYMYMKYIEELIKRFGAVGIFTGDDKNPVAWSFIKKGVCVCHW